MKKLYITLLACLPLAFTSCDDLLTPADENNQGINVMDQDPSFAQGILANAYIELPYTSYPNSDLATDDAVSNDKDNSYRKLASGGLWASDNDPFAEWIPGFDGIQYINLFLAHCSNVPWANEENVNTLFDMRFRGEAYGLRALFMYYLLRSHAGYDDNGELLGVPILTEPQSSTSDFNIPRNTFKDCIDSLVADANRAIELLPDEYVDINSDAEIPSKYTAIGITNATDYNRVCGATMGGRLAGNVAKAIKAEALMMAASPAYSDASGVTYEEAADAAAVVIDELGGVDGLADNGYTWYANADEIANLAAGANPQEIIWRGGTSNSNNLESDNFPPTLYGKGRVNPTQNLVDAFPMANGYPITDDYSDYDAEDPYFGRDPRFYAYIIYNGATAGTDNKVIITGNYGETTNDQLNHEDGYSTRTGYYLKKLLRQDCNLNPNYNTTQKHYTSYIRATEIYLDYAEAANEAYGPTGTGSHGYSAYDVIKRIRQRAGIEDDEGGDGYLDECSLDKAKMRELIRNERRIELCFENVRFWDLRRWKVDLTKLNETAQGMQITEDASGNLVYTVIDVEKRDYEDYMYYGPIPHSETLKFSNLQQNKGYNR
jgi:hypothetical protein